MSLKPDSAVIWQLQRGLDRRFRSGHPWVYSNELANSPKGLVPGGAVELRDATGKFLARGYGNPHSLIAFRAMTRDPAEVAPLERSAILAKLTRAAHLRHVSGFQSCSFRLCFGESDGIPGLVIDRYAIQKGQVFVVQAHTAGADRILPLILDVLRDLSQSVEGFAPWDSTAVVLRNDLAVRKLEGLEEEIPRLLKELSGIDLRKITIFVKSVLGSDVLPFQVDLLEGQKTGFFLDQFANIQLAALRLQNLPGSRLKVLDLCSYVGQWGVQLGSTFTKQGKKVEVTVVDASAQALEFARANLQEQGVACNPLKLNVLKDLGSLPSESFDLVISDPPALIKSRKDIPTGTHAYLQLLTQVFRLVRKEGAVVCCSCSALLEEESFVDVLTKAASRNQRTVRWVGRGAQSPDHPILTEFPEGRYLKGWTGFVD